MITAETIDRVREAADIVEIVGEHVKLRRTGADFRGPCPFHGGKNPNFSVSPRRNVYHCFKCGVSGDVFDFVKERLGLDFVEAVKYVAQRAGVEVREERRGEQGPDPRESLWEANAAAAQWFRDTLWTEDEARGARDYLASRDIDKSAADRFELGYAPRDGAKLRAHLNAMGYDDERLVAAGLLVKYEDQQELRTRFRGRLMIPILDTSGRHVGFGGRVIGEGEPKYLNSAESEIFVKGRLLYGLSSARHAARKAERVLVVEGYFDAIRLALAGIEETVAPLGTALTEQQAALLAKLTRNVFLLYDSDEAGLKATFRAGLELLRHGVSARVASLPQGEDPDTFVRTHGAARLEAHLAQAVDIFDRQILELQRRGWFEELHKKRRAIDKLLPTLRATSDPLTRDIYVTRLAEVTGVDRDVLLRELAQPEARRRAGRPAAPAPGELGVREERVARGGTPNEGPSDGIVYVRPRPQPETSFNRDRARGPGDRRRGFRRREDWLSTDGIPRVSPSAAVTRLERGLVRAMLQVPDQVDVVAERWGPSHFTSPIYRRIFERLVEVDDRSLPTIADGLAEGEVRVVNDLVAEPAPGAEADAQLWLRQLEVRALEEERKRIDARLKNPDHPLTDDETNALMAQKARLRSEIRMLRVESAPSRLKEE